jgi:hypothetical protein
MDEQTRRKKTHDFSRGTNKKQPPTHDFSRGPSRQERRKPTTSVAGRADKKEENPRLQWLVIILVTHPPPPSLERRRGGLSGDSISPSLRKRGI